MSSMASCRWMAGLALVLLAYGSRAADPEDFAETPKGAEIKRGMDASDTCSGALPLQTAKFAPCVLAIADKNHQKGGNTSVFDAGLYFDAWLDLDLLARPDEPPAVDVTRKAAIAAKPDAARLVRLYREAQRKAGVTDDQVLLVSMLDDTDGLKKRLAAAERGY